MNIEKVAAGFRRPKKTVEQRGDSADSLSPHGYTTLRDQTSLRDASAQTRTIFLALVSLTLGFTLLGAGKAQAGTGFSPFVDQATPWSVDDLEDPLGTGGAMPYVPDPGFSGGNYLRDEFAAGQTGATSYFLGRKVAKLPDGDVVVAALVKNPGGNQTNGFWNVGLVRYSPNGIVRRTWGSPGAFGHNANQYVVYPKSDSGSFTWIQDIKIVDSFIVVSTNLQFAGGTDADVRILVFGLDGGFRSFFSPFGTSQNEYIGGMDGYRKPLGGYGVVVAGTVFPTGTVPRPIFNRLALSDSGILSADTGTVPLNVAGCASTADSCEVRAMALAYPAISATTAPPSVFIATTRRIGGTGAEANISVLRVNVDGTGSSTWAATTWNTSPGGNRGDFPFGVGVKTTGLGLPASPTVYTVYVASNIDRACRAGISILRQSTIDNGASAQTVNYGGGDQTGVNCAQFPPSGSYGNGVAMQNGKFAVVGGRVQSPFVGTGEDSFNSEMAVFEDLVLTARDIYPYPLQGPRERHGAFGGVVGAGNDKFIATGDLRYRNASDVPANLRGKQSVSVLGLMPDDTIFANGFE